MGPIEYALFAEACRQDGKTLIDNPPVDAELDCMAEAIAQTCRSHGMTTAAAAEFLRIAASNVHLLEAEIKGRPALRRAEQQMLRAIGRASETSPESEM